MSKDQFIGVWKLISCEAVRRRGGAVPIYGEDPVGRLYYDAAGNMSVHIMAAARPKFVSETKFRAAPDEMRRAYESYEAYFSEYTVDESRLMISHRVIGGLFPNWTGGIQDRFYKFEGRDRLILSTEPVDAPRGMKTVVILVWERLV